MPDTDDSQRSGGISGALARLTGSLIALLRTRLELATVEFDEERERTKEMLLLAVCAALLGMFALLFASLFVIAYFWDSNRLAAVGAVTVFYVVLAMAVCARMKQRLRDKPTPFAATLSELEQDAASLRRKP
ncbi:MAG TPA: phage holin family protein [Casimicrobiaceae bacterium]|nr:phage holin family protein [Casimicrobiaceae bacterium]